MHIKDRLFIVTGGASGLGAATVKALFDQGAHIAILDRDTEAGPELCKALDAKRVTFYQSDMAEDETVETAVAAVIEHSQKVGVPLRGAVTCAGVGMAGRIVGRGNKPFDLETFKYVLQINLFGTFQVCRLVAAHIASLDLDPEAHERGCLVMVSSAAATQGQIGQVSYAASKGAINALTLPMARDMAKLGIRTVTIAPSLFDTNMGKSTPDKARQALESMLEFPARFGNAAEFGHMARALIENTYANGEVYPISGGSRLGKL